MTNDEWWTTAVDQFGLDEYLQPNPPALVSSERVAPDVTRRRRTGRSPASWIAVAVVSFGLALLMRTFVIQQFAVDGDSMLGTLHSGDRVIVNKLSYDLHDPRRGDVVVLEDFDPRLDVRDLIKRVIALPGETVEYRDCRLLINGDLVTESYLDPQFVRDGSCGDPQAPVEVEPDHVFVMGDNRAASLDSRAAAIGQIPFDNLIGRAFVVVWPTWAWRWL